MLVRVCENDLDSVVRVYGYCHLEPPQANGTPLEVSNQADGEYTVKRWENYRTRKRGLLAT